MDTITLKPARLQGIHHAIPSKSYVHRMAICAALSDKPTILNLDFFAEDTIATLDCLRALGARVSVQDTQVKIYPIQGFSTSSSHFAFPTKGNSTILDCKESGSTFRFLLPVATALCNSVTFTGEGRLPERPIIDLITQLKFHGVNFSQNKLPFTTHGVLQHGAYELPGNISSQYISALLMAMPLLHGASKLSVCAPLESSAYVSVTMDVMRQFGVSVSVANKNSALTFSVDPNAKYTSPGIVNVEGDWSNASFFLLAAALGNKIGVKGLNLRTRQPDLAILEVFKKFGCAVNSDEDAEILTVKASQAALRGQSVDISQMPDTLPALAVLAAGSVGESRFINAARLRMKESDRLLSTASMINSLGGKAKIFNDSLIVLGCDIAPLTGGCVNSTNDHRIAMAGAIASTLCSKDVEIVNAGAVNKSYPGFFDEFTSLIPNNSN